VLIAPLYEQEMTPLDLHADTTTNDRPTLLRQLAAGCYRRRRMVVAAWVVAVIAVSAIAGAAAGEFDNEFGLPGSESQEAFDLLEESGFEHRMPRVHIEGSREPVVAPQPEPELVAR
jgi:RND superfamily putative drug exporter